MNDILGTDIKVVPHMVAHDASEIDLVRRRRTSSGLRARANADLFDIDTFSGRENLAQALILRLLTPRGSLSALGHSAYGSRLHELIGRRKTDALRNLCRAFVLEVVAQEPRVKDAAVEVMFDPLQEQVDSFVFTLVVEPIDATETLSLSLEVGL